MASREPTMTELIAQIPAARARGRAEWRAGRLARSAAYDPVRQRIVIELSNSCQFAFPVRSIKWLRGMSADDLALVEVLPGGSGITWEKQDIDLSVPGLLLFASGTEEPRRHFAREAGRATSPAKAAAARANGAKGGRPRKARKSA